MNTPLFIANVFFFGFPIQSVHTKSPLTAIIESFSKASTPRCECFSVLLYRPVGDEDKLCGASLEYNRFPELEVVKLDKEEMSFIKTFRNGENAIKIKFIFTMTDNDFLHGQYFVLNNIEGSEEVIDEGVCQCVCHVVADDIFNC